MHDLIPLDPALPGALTTAEIDLTMEFAANEKSAATRAAYASDWRDFAIWCHARAATPLPAHPGIVAAYLSHLASSGRKASTIGRRAAAISHRHKLAGHEPPTNAEGVKATLRGIRRSIGTAREQKAPATADIVAGMLKHCRTDTLRGIRDRALLCVGLGCALRRSELVSLNVEDLTTTKNGILVRIVRSKTDQEASGFEIPLLRGVHLCPCDALEAWLAAASISSGAIFRAISRGKVSDERLTAQVVSLRLKFYARKAGFDPATLSAHSLRAGFVTSSAEHRADLFRIADVTRHKSLEMLKLYCRRADAWRGHAGAGWL